MSNRIEKASAKLSAKARMIMNIIFIVVVLAVVVGANILTSFIVKRNPASQVDFTSDGAYSLQAGTVEYLNYLEDEIVIKVLCSEDKLISYDSSFGYQANQLILKFSTYSNIEVEFVEDLQMTSVSAWQEKYPDIDWKALNEILLVESKTSGRYAGVKRDDFFTVTYDSSSGENVVIGQNVESEILSAIQRVTSEKIVKVGISVGNGEFLSADSQYYAEFSNLKGTLTHNAYDVEDINLSTTVPNEDMEIIIMVAPIYDLTAEAADNLTNWLQNNGEYGKTLVYVPFYLAEDTPNLDLIIEQWGMTVTRGMVEEKDESKTLSSGGAFLPDYADEKFTATLNDTSKPVAFGTDCMPIKIRDEKIASSILTTSSKAVVHLIDDEGLTGETEEAGENGITVAAVATKTADTGETSNVVVWGSIAGLQDNVMKMPNYNNESYFVNMLNTLSDNEVQGIVVNGAAFSGSVMTVTDGVRTAFRIIFVIVVPLALIGACIFVFVRRRNR